jgi:hypothetical protein
MPVLNGFEWIRIEKEAAMAEIEGVVFCDGCGVEITWSPVVLQGAKTAAHQRAGQYCCVDCADGRPCQCGERMEFDDEFREHGKISIPF